MLTLARLASLPLRIRLPSTTASQVLSPIGTTRILLTYPVLSRNASSTTSTTDAADMSDKNPGNVIGGHKANINNPTRNEATKAHSQAVLDEQFEGGEGPGGHQGAETRQEKNEGNVIGGYKATLSNPTTGTGAKAKAKKKLNEMGVEVEDG